MKVLVTGAGGLIGQALVRAGATGLTHKQLDITDQGALAELLDAGPNCVINAAAQAGVDKAEQQPERTEAVNHHAVAALARACQQRGIRLVHIGTDYSLNSDADLVPEMTPAPVGVYATSKSRGEQAAAAHGAVVVRVQWVYHPDHTGFFARTLAALAQGRTVSLVTDQVGTPTPADLVARGLLMAAAGTQTGLFHLACLGETTPWGWIEAAAQQLHLPFSARPITRADLGGAPRPARSVLNSDRFLAAFTGAPGSDGEGLVLPRWDVALGDVLEG
ncbi:MAG: NAD(P)-dependent oxidoreductase [Oligoflexia bacterium]|nr:NAD(P)-dependent oxidoreductase [Oligoflexia bacterium]